jgi:hypothetical protein
MNMSMKRNSYLDDYSEETISQLLSVSKKILTKAELSLQESPFIESGKVWFSLPDHNDELPINKLADLGIIRILDENFQTDPIPHVLAFKLNINLGILRDFVKDAEVLSQDKTRTTEDTSVDWPEYYKWDESGRNFLVGEDKKLSFQSSEDTRCKIFNALVLRKGDWVRVSTISSELNMKDKAKIRTVINQIRNRIKENGLSDHLKIDTLGTRKSVSQGAYRVTA